MCSGASLNEFRVALITKVPSALYNSFPGLIRVKSCKTSMLDDFSHVCSHVTGCFFRCLASCCNCGKLCLGAGMVLTSWECRGTNPGKLASLPALGLVTFRDALMGSLLLTFVVDSGR